MSIRHFAYGVFGQIALAAAAMVESVLFGTPLPETEYILTLGFVIGLSLSFRGST